MEEKPTRIIRKMVLVFWVAVGFGLILILILILMEN
jgi:hypothetical protein